MLIKAGITRAESLICTVSPDSAALMTVLTAHVIAPDLEIVAKATLPESEAKLVRAGASRDHRKTLPLDDQGGIKGGLDRASHVETGNSCSATLRVPLLRGSPRRR